MGYDTFAYRLPCAKFLRDTYIIEESMQDNTSLRNPISMLGFRWRCKIVSSFQFEG